MNPILLIHGYSAESKDFGIYDIEKIYGSLPQRLRNKYGPDLVRDIDLSRYISLDDGITIDDVSRALNNALFGTPRFIIWKVQRNRSQYRGSSYTKLA